jgi:hypothetical protein
MIIQASCRFPQRRRQDEVITIFYATAPSKLQQLVVRATFYDLLSRKWILSPHTYSARASDLI